MERFSEMIKKRRVEKGLTMRGLENELKKNGVSNISRSFINLMEKNLRRPSYDAAFQLARVLDLDLEELLKAAYRSRTEHDKMRERRYLEALINNNKLEHLNIVNIIN